MHLLATSRMWILQRELMGVRCVIQLRLVSLLLLAAKKYFRSEMSLPMPSRVWVFQKEIDVALVRDDDNSDDDFGHR